jgi:hypothetical protein
MGCHLDFDVTESNDTRVPIGADEDPTKTLIMGIDSMW